jgi:hypothetical protein
MLYVFLRIVIFHNVNPDYDLYNGSTSKNILLGKLLVSKYINTIKPKDVSYTKFWFGLVWFGLVWFGLVLRVIRF